MNRAVFVGNDFGRADVKIRCNRGATGTVLVVVADAVAAIFSVRELVGRAGAVLCFTLYTEIGHFVVLVGLKLREVHVLVQSLVVLR